MCQTIGIDRASLIVKPQVVQAKWAFSKKNIQIKIMLTVCLMFFSLPCDTWREVSSILQCGSQDRTRYPARGTGNSEYPPSYPSRCLLHTVLYSAWVNSCRLTLRIGNRPGMLRTKTTIDVVLIARSRASFWLQTIKYGTFRKQK